jgi:feruloyl esterase
VNKAVLAACDAKDGLADGILQNPLACTWDPKEIVCKSGQGGDCLTSAQADVVRKIYEGARNSKGELLYWGMPRGSEDQWAVWLRPRPNQGVSITAHLGFSPSAPPDWTVYDFDYDRDPARLAMNSFLQDPVNPDLTAFKKAGGRMILFHGYNDNNIPAEASIDYYERAVRTMGGRKETDPFFRLFTPPAVNHCRGGDGGGSIDWITALEEWIEQGKAPDMVLAYHPTKPYPSIAREVTDYGATYSKLDRFPIKAEDYDRVRPLYPYPAYARYTRGDPKLPSSYTRAMP